MRTVQVVFREQTVRRFVLKRNCKILVISDSESNLSHNPIAKEGIAYLAAVEGYSLKFTDLLMCYVLRFALHF